MGATTKAGPQVARAAGTLWLVVLTPGEGGWRSECRHEDGRVLPVDGGPWPVAPLALLAGLRLLERLPAIPAAPGRVAQSALPLFGGEDAA